MANSRRIAPNALTTRNSRFVMGGVTEVNGEVLGWWERVSTDALRSFAETTWMITHEYVGRPDLIADRFYGTVSLAWLILQHNNIVDDIEELVEGRTLSIPDPERVRIGLASLNTSNQNRTQ